MTSTNHFSRVIIILMLSLIFLSCSRKKTDDILKNCRLISFKEIPIDFMLGNPYQMKMLDHYLIIADFVDNRMLTIYDLNTNKLIRRVINEGQGPEEMIRPLYIDVSAKNNTINILQRQTGNYSEHLLNDLIEGVVNQSNKINLGNVENVVKAEEHYLAEGFYNNGDIGFYDKTGSLISVNQVFPSYLDQINSISDRYRLGQGKICYNELSQTFLFASYFTGDISFFSLSENQLVKAHSINMDNRIEIRIKNNPGDVDIRRDDIEHSIDVAYTSDHFYVLYSGETMQDRQNAKSSYILKFDSKGRFTHCFKSNKKLFNICVTEDNNTIYAIILTDDLDFSLAEITL